MSLVGLILIPLLIAVALVVVRMVAGTFRSHQRGTSWSVGLALVFVILGILGCVAGTLDAVQEVRADSKADQIKAPVTWYTHSAVTNLLEARPGGGSLGTGQTVDMPIEPHRQRLNDVNKQAHTIRLDGIALLPHPSHNKQVLAALYTILPWIIGLLGLACALPVLANASKGDPFARSSIRALSVLGWVVLVGLVARELIGDRLSEWVVVGTVWTGSGPSTTSINLLVFIPGLAVLALAAIFRSGATLREFEQETV